MDIVEDTVDQKYYLKPEQAEKLLDKLDQKSMDILLKEINKESVLPCITPERVNKRQNGKRLKNSNDPMFTLTASDRHGIVEMEQLVGGSQGERVYSANGLSVTLSANGGGAGAKTGLYTFIDLSKKFPLFSKHARCIQARYQKGLTNRKREISGICTIQNPHGFNQGGIHKIAPTITATSFKDNNFLLKYIKQCCAIRRLTPKECFRLQGASDKMFDLAQNAMYKNKTISDAQLYKMAGNGVTIPVITAIVCKM